MTAPLDICKQGFRFIASPQARGTFLSLGIPGAGCVGLILDHAESDELEQLLAAARLNRPTAGVDGAGTKSARQPKERQSHAA